MTPNKHFNSITYQRALLPMNLLDLVDAGITPDQAFDLGTINPKLND